MTFAVVNNEIYHLDEYTQYSFCNMTFVEGIIEILPNPKKILGGVGVGVGVGYRMLFTSRQQVCYSCSKYHTNCKQVSLRTYIFGYCINVNLKSQFSLAFFFDPLFKNGFLSITRHWIPNINCS